MDMRTERMVEQAPDYYQQARSYIEIQDTIAQELNRQETNDEDLKNQLRVMTATWGLRYWEEAVGLSVMNSTNYELRRSRVLGRLRSGGSFSRAMLKAVAEAYTERPVDVEIDVKEYQVFMYLYHEFLTEPSFFAQIDNIIHAHLGIEYRVVFEYPKQQTLGQQYQRWRYPLQIVDTFLTGVHPEPSTLGRLIEQRQDVSQAYYQNQTPYKFAGARVAGSTDDFTNLQLNRNKQQNLEPPQYEKQLTRYMAAGEALVGSFLAANDVQHKNLTTAARNRTQHLSEEYSRSSWAYKLCGRINAGTGVYV
ncbi:tail protein [Bacillus phage vB_BboS-125]|uniref:DUF2313 domain-containing protein n=1 Tax=Bacillus phage vB_BboS-125 TaxID=2419618 RepID=A0A3G3BVT2_9CAUD|nr:tail protein [Bacillus phage vB_BboS-125]AYP68375.1 hypothetical protein BboS125_00005 [Bacillus phage vB_BboS-125]